MWVVVGTVESVWLQVAVRVVEYEAVGVYVAEEAEARVREGETERETVERVREPGLADREEGVRDSVRTERVREGLGAADREWDAVRLRVSDSRRDPEWVKVRGRETECVGLALRLGVRVRLRVQVRVGARLAVAVRVRDAVGEKEAEGEWEWVRVPLGLSLRVRGREAEAERVAVPGESEAVVRVRDREGVPVGLPLTVPVVGVSDPPEGVGLREAVGEKEGDGAQEALWVVERLGLGLGLPEALGLRVHEGDALGEAVGEEEWEGEGRDAVAVAEAERLRDREADGVWVRERLPAKLGEAVGVREGVRVVETEADRDGLREYVAVPSAVPDPVCVSEKETVPLGDGEGVMVAEGCVGVREREEVWVWEGEAVTDGEAEGEALEVAVVVRVGTVERVCVREGVGVGEREGAVRVPVGEGVGEGGVGVWVREGLREPLVVLESLKEAVWVGDGERVAVRDRVLTVGVADAETVGVLVGDGGDGVGLVLRVAEGVAEEQVRVQEGDREGGLGVVVAVQDAEVGVRVAVALREGAWERL